VRKAEGPVTASLPITVLLIDPYKEDREYWTQRLKISAPEYIVLEAETGNEGILICRTQRVDCVLVELNLPDMSGFQMLIELVPRARHPEIAVIILTRLALPPMESLAVNNGAQAYLVKSHVSGDDLYTTIRQAISVVGTTRIETHNSSCLYGHKQGS
jgi:DNA-binding NarL/FixJ family response regulator